MVSLHRLETSIKPMFPKFRPTQPFQDATRRAPDGWDSACILEIVLSKGSFSLLRLFLASRR